MQLFSPMEYLKIDVAGSFGLDKQNWYDRIKWFDEHEAQFEPLLAAAEAGKPTKGTLLAQADAPALFYANSRRSCMSCCFQTDYRLLSSERWGC